MIRSSDIPHLLRLLDDESAVVQSHVQKAFLTIGEDLEPLLLPFMEDLPAEQARLLRDLCQQIRLKEFDTHWLDWLEVEDERRALESGLGWLSFYNKAFGAPQLSDSLDELTAEFVADYPIRTIPKLMHFLYVDKGFSAPGDEYYHPDNSNLIQVLIQREGLQISLASIAILMARRLGLELYGFNMPGHFMMVSAGDRGPRIYDPFNKGKALPAQTMSFLDRSLRQQRTSIVELRANTREIILRVLHNLLNVYKKKEDKGQLRFWRNRVQALVTVLKAREKR